VIAKKLQEESKRQVLAKSALQFSNLNSCGLHVREKT
jgi:hypothetical protein